MMRSVPVLEGNGVRLRPLQQSDIAERVAAGRWQAEYSRSIAGDLAPVKQFTEGSGQAWFESRPDSMRWAIEIDGRLGGEIRLDRIEEQDRNASLAIGIFRPELWGKGYGTESIRLALDHAFKTLGMHRIWLLVMESNKRAIAAYEKCGFTVEGRLRDSVRTSKGWDSDLVMGILRSEYDRLSSDRTHRKRFNPGMETKS